MRLRLLVRRLTVSAPRMAVRSALPWPLRWVLLAMVLGFCAAIALWAFEFGKDIAGLDRGTKNTLHETRVQLDLARSDLTVLKEERDKAQFIANTVDTLMTSERVVREKLVAQNKLLEAENQRLRNDLGFFEKLIPTADGGVLSIRSLQAEIRQGREVQWQVLVIQSQKNQPEFNGRLELSFSGVLNGKPWSALLPGGAPVLKLKQYGRLEGVFEVPPHVVIKAVTAKVLDGSTVKAQQVIKL
jgi:hypothetical protein